MEQDKLIEMIEQIKKDPRAKEAFGKAAEFSSPEEAVAFFAGLAEKCGYSVSGDDLLEIVKTAEAQQKKRTEESALKIERLSDDEMAQAAGGWNNGCEYSFRDYENCWAMDGCDKNRIYYETYDCENNYLGTQCGAGHSMLCNALFIILP